MTKDEMLSFLRNTATTANEIADMLEAASPVVVPPTPAPPIADWGISDAATGTTGAAFYLGADVMWQNANGDWTDADAVSQGLKPIASYASARVDTPQRMDLDITDFVQLAKPLEFIIRAPNAPRSSDPVANRPMLVVDYNDGTTKTLPADVAITLGGGSALVQKNSLVLTGNSNIALRFPNPGKNIKNAVIQIPGVDAHWSGATPVNLYQVKRPSPPGGSPQLGIAQSFPLDANIKSDLRVLFSLDLDRPWNELFYDNGVDWTSNVNFDWTGKNPALYPQVSAGRIINGSDSGADFRVADTATETLGGFQNRDSRIKKVLRVHSAKGLELFSDRIFLFKPTATGDQHEPIMLNGKLPQQMHVRFSVRLGTNFFLPEGGPYNGGKWFPGFAHRTSFAGNGGAFANGTNGWSARGQFIVPNTIRDPLYAKRILWGTYGYAKEPGSQFPRMYGMGGCLTLGQWHDCEVGVVMNTPGQANGRLRAWVDGIPVFDKSDYLWRDPPPYIAPDPGNTTQFPPIADMGILQMWWNDYFGGVGWITQQDMTYHLSNLVIATDYIGPVKL